MTTEREQVEYPDEAGYPDGTGFLDEGSAGGGSADPDGDGPPAPPLDDLAEFAMTDEEDEDPNL
ncbi:hypothetical protein [Leifsonia poae]|uniref:hypothetical protein n=1 Tax=Leifsonia poae TaxID=110933 RepID=UPI003D664BCE